MAYAVTTEGQGANAYIAMPNWVFNATAGTVGVSKIEIKLKILSFRTANFAYLLGATNSTQNALRVDPTTMRLVYRTGATNRIESANNSITLGQIHTARLEYAKATTTTSLYLDDVFIGSYISANTINFNQINRFSTTTNTQVDMVVYSVSTLSDATYSTYTDSWDDTTATGSGSTWISTGGTRQLTLTNFTGATDSWWASYGGGGAEILLNASLAAQASVTASLTTGIRLAASLNVAASVSASLYAKIRMRATLQSSSDVAAWLTTQIRLAASLSSNATLSAVLTNVPDVYAISLYASANVYANLTTQIRMAASLNASPSIAASLTVRSPSSGKFMQRWDGAEFDSHLLKRYDGARFTVNPLRKWDGDSWQDFNG